MALTAAEQQELSGLQNDSQAQASAPGLSASEQAELHQLSSDPEASPPQSMLSKGLSVLGKGLDWQRGVASPAMAKLIALSSGVPYDQIMKPGEYSAGVDATTTRRAPGADTMLARSGVPQGGHLSDYLPDGLFVPPGSAENKPWYYPSHLAPEKGGMWDVTPRGVAGGILDMGADPLTYESGGVNKLVQGAKAAGEELSPAMKGLSTLLNPASNTVEGVGKAAYSSGMTPLIAKGAQYGKDVKESLYNNGMFGSPGRVARVGDEAAEKLLNSRNATMQSAQNVINEGEVPFLTPVRPKNTPPTLPTNFPNSELEQQMALPGHELQPDLFRQETPPNALRSLKDLRSTPSAIGAEVPGPQIKLDAFGNTPTGVSPVQEGTSSFLADPENHMTGASLPKDQSGAQQLSLPWKGGYEATGPVQTRLAEAPQPLRAYQPLIDHINQMVADKRISAEKGQALLDGFAHKLGPSSGDTTLAQMSQWKSDAAQAARDSAWDTSKDRSFNQDLLTREANGNRDEIARAANNAFPGSGDVINETNNELGHLLTVQGVADKQAARSGNARLIAPNASNHAMTTAVVTGDPVAGAAHLAGSTLMKIINDRTARNTLGYLARKAGTGTVSAPLIDAAAVNTLRNMANKNQPVAGVGK